MRHQLHIQLRSSEGAVMRTLGLIERRGFMVCSMNLSEADGHGRSLTVNLESSRSPELLRRQLERLHDVLWVEHQSAPSQGQWAGAKAVN